MGGSQEMIVVQVRYQSMSLFESEARIVMMIDKPFWAPVIAPCYGCLPELMGASKLTEVPRLGDFSAPVDRISTKNNLRDLNLNH
jgi:hypothetical protein